MGLINGKYIMESDDITKQVLLNCNISDARYAGLHSICGLALRLRDLYKWEKGLEPWVEEDSSNVLEWIGHKEDKWETLSEREFENIVIQGRSYHPFETDAINSILVMDHLFYHAGYAGAMRPTFFLAGVEERREINGYHVIITGKELARDLLALPALSRNDTIIIRKEAGLRYLWDQMMFIRKSGKKALGFALSHYGLTNHGPGSLQYHLKDILKSEMEVYLRHELGELEGKAFERDIWRELIAKFPYTPLELYIRAVKDLLADTNESGTLQYIISEKRVASLGFYFAFLDGLRKELFKDGIEAFEVFMKSADWNFIEQAVLKTHQKMADIAREMSRIFREGMRNDDMDWIQDEMNSRFLTPLGIR